MKFKKRIALALATCMIAISLSACGGKGTPSEAGKGTPSEAGKGTPSETGKGTPSENGKASLLTSTTISEAFAQKSIWFRTYKGKEPAKDTKIDSVYAFDGKGNVTIYTIGEVPYDSNPDTVYEPLCFGDLRDLSDKEILKLVKEKNKTWFEVTKQRVIKDMDATIARYGDDEEMRATRNKWEQLAYESETNPQPFTLEIKTDGTGNQTAEEMLCYTASPARGYIDNYGFELKGHPAKIKLHSTSGSSVVYDMVFMGCGELYQMRNEGEFGWALDTPDTKGIKVD